MYNVSFQERDSVKLEYQCIWPYEAAVREDMLAWHIFLLLEAQGTVHCRTLHTRLRSIANY